MCAAATEAMAESPGTSGTRRALWLYLYVMKGAREKDFVPY
jgi:hypothetical protein